MTVSEVDVWHVLWYERIQAGMAELADAQDLGSCAERRMGSSPTARIEKRLPEGSLLCPVYSIYPFCRR